VKKTNIQPIPMTSHVPDIINFFLRYELFFTRTTSFNDTFYGIIKYDKISKSTQVRNSPKLTYTYQYRHILLPQQFIYSIHQSETEIHVKWVRNSDICWMSWETEIQVELVRNRDTCWTSGETEIHVEWVRNRDTCWMS